MYKGWPNYCGHTCIRLFQIATNLCMLQCFQGKILQLWSSKGNSCVLYCPGLLTIKLIRDIVAIYVVAKFGHDCFIYCVCYKC